MLYKYQVFHATRIMNVLLEQQTPNNDHGDNDLSSSGNFRGGISTIISSLYEMDLIKQDEYTKISRILLQRDNSSL